VPDDIKRALALFVIACLIHWAAVAGILLLRLRA